MFNPTSVLSLTHMPGMGENACGYIHPRRYGREQSRCFLFFPSRFRRGKWNWVREMTLQRDSRLQTSHTCLSEVPRAESDVQQMFRKRERENLQAVKEVKEDRISKQRLRHAHFQWCRNRTWEERYIGSGCCTITTLAAKCTISGAQKTLRAWKSSESLSTLALTDSSADFSYQGLRLCKKGRELFFRKKSNEE